MSNAFDRSICSRTVLSGGLFLLNPVDTCMLNSFSAVTVECCCLKPCWWLGITRCSFRVGINSLSRIFIDGQSKETGL